MNFPTIEELKTLSLNQLRNLPIQTVEQERQVQKVLDSRAQTAPLPNSVYRGDVPFHIKTIEEETKWQKIIDEREANLRGADAIHTKEERLEHDIETLEHQKVEVEKELRKSKQFCQYCDSKGHFHKSNCTRTK